MTPSEALADLEYRIYSLSNIPTHKACLGLLNEAFLLAPAAQSKHHAYTGGLVVHTAEVLQGCMSQLQAYPNASAEVLICAAVFHDCQKVLAYELNRVLDSDTGQLVVVCDSEHPGGWRYTDYAFKIGHLSGSFSRWNDIAWTWGVDKRTIAEVGHCILSHHGRKEWGSPVEPQTLEALILSQADALSAHYGAGREIPR